MNVENVLIQILLKAPSSVWARYAWSAIIVGAFVILRAALESHLEGRPFLLFFFPVFLSALLFDRGSGYFATALAAVAASVLWVKPEGGLIPESPGDLLALLLFLTMCIGVATLTEALRASLEKVARSEQEKSTLLRELNHRVLNDLQGVTSLLRMGYKRSGDSRDVLLRAAERIDVVTRVYSRLQAHDLTAAIQLKDFVEGLVNDLRLALAGNKPVHFSVSVEPATVTLRCATAIGMIVNELVTNAIKYAFDEGQLGQISIKVRREGEVLILTVCDDGKGMKVSHGGVGSGLGIVLVRQLAQQHEGDVVYVTPDQSEAGVLVTVRLNKDCLINNATVD